MVAEERVYRALAILQSKAGTELEGGGESFKINRDSLAEVADPESMRTLQRRKVYSVEGGLPVHVAARLLGYDNVTEFVADLIEAPGRKTRVDALIQEHIDLTFPAMMDTGEIRSVAIEKVQNAKGKLLEREIEILAERLGRPRSREAHAAARRLMAEKAREMIAGKQYRKVKPSEYLRAERRAAREAIEAAKNGDLATVERLKKRQQFNAYLYSAGMDARSAGRKHRTYLMRVSKKPTQVKLGKAGLDYQNRVNELIESVELAPRSEKWDQRKESLAKWLENPDNAATLDGPLLKSLQSQTETRSWDSLTVRQQQELRDAVQAIVKQATLKDLLLKNLRWRKEDDAAVAVVAELEENLPPVREVKDENLRTIIDKGLSWVTSFDTAHRMLSSWARDAGGGKLGAFFDAFVEPLGTADSNLLQMKQRMTEGFLNLTKQWEADGRSVNDRMGGNQNREGVLVMALNWGNLGNRDRLMKGHGMSEAQVQAYLDMMDATDLQFVQGVFDLIETMWPELAEVSRRLTGLVPGKVEAEPIIAAAGTIAGGYYPIVYDKQQSGKVMTRESADEVLSNLGKSMRATTAKGHREARQKEGTGAKLRMSLDVIPQHIDTVSIDIVYSEVIRDINTLLDDSRVSGAIDNHLGVGANAAIRQLIIDIVRPARSGTVVDKLTRGLRNGVSVAALGFRLATVLMQTAGVTNSMRYTGAGKFMAAAKRVASSPIESIKFITDASPMMAQRYEIGKVREAREAVEDLRGSSWRRKLTVAAYWAMTKVQFAMVDAPTWMAAYEARKLEGDSEARAVAVADQTVTDAQGGGRRMDLNEVQRSQWLNLFTVFGTFMFRQYNQLRETGGGIRRDGLTLKHVHDAALIFIMPAVLTTIIRLGIGMMRGDEDEKYDLENLPETFAKEFGIELASSAVSGIALAREIPGAIEYGYSGPAGTRGIGLISELLKRVGTGDFSERTVSTALQSAGIFFKLPTGQLDTMFKAVMDMMEEDEIRPQSLLLGPPKR